MFETTNQISWFINHIKYVNISTINHSFVGVYGNLESYSSLIIIINQYQPLLTTVYII